MIEISNINDSYVKNDEFTIKSGSLKVLTNSGWNCLISCNNDM